MIPAAIIPKIAKLLPLLASDQDGEVVATARAIGRTLAAGGSDFHALATAIAAPTSTNIDWSAFAADVAAGFKAEPDTEKMDPNAPEAPTTRWGLPIWGVKKIEPWNVVAQHCLSLDWMIPKAAGGKFLTKPEREALKSFSSWSSRQPTNAEADWIETVVTRCHEVRDAWRDGNQRSTA